jgi:hypothetical protein
VINPDRRPVRYLQMQAKMDVGGFPAGTVSRVAASDGNTFDLADDEQLAQLFSLTDWRYGGSPFNPYQDHSYRSNVRPSAATAAPLRLTLLLRPLQVLGCAHSHLRVWDTIAARGDAYREEFGLSNGDTNYGDGAVAYLVLEDDVEFIGENIYEKLTALAGRLRRNSEWDILYLGLLDEEHEGLYGDAVVGRVEGVVKLSKEPRWSGAGAFGMLVRPRAAKKVRRASGERRGEQAGRARRAKRAQKKEVGPNRPRRPQGGFGGSPPDNPLACPLLPQVPASNSSGCSERGQKSAVA